MGRIRNMLTFGPTGSTLATNEPVDMLDPPTDHVDAEGIDTNDENDGGGGDAGGNDPAPTALDANGLLSALSAALGEVETSVLGSDSTPEDWEDLGVAERRSALFERVDALLGELDGEDGRTGADVAGGDPSPEGNAVPHVPDPGPDPFTHLRGQESPDAYADEVPSLWALAATADADGDDWMTRPEDSLGRNTPAYQGNCGCGCATSRDPAAKERGERNDRATSRDTRPKVGVNYAGLVGASSVREDVTGTRFDGDIPLVVLADDGEEDDE